MNPSTPRMPALFIGHGSPMNALADNSLTQAWTALGQRLPRPQAVLAISAHWETKGTLITAAEHPRTIHDFYNFPPALHAMQYPAPGDPALANRIEALLAPHARADVDGWGLDHGVWSVLKFLYPQADVPVVQLSMDVRKTPAEHQAVGAQLSALRDEGVLIFGSGNIVHNLRLYDPRMTAGAEWAVQFNDAVKDRVLAGDDAALADYKALPGAALAVPEAEHYLPLLYVLGAKQPGDAVEILTDEVTGSLSMTSVLVGA
jgi:4,5-DOPA dioxygenase extradiol